MNKHHIHTIILLVISMLVCITLLVFSPLVAATPQKTDGASLYTKNCSGCHGKITDSTKIGALPSEIQTAIDGKICNMQGLAFLKTEQISAISKALLEADTYGMKPSADSTNGAELYSHFCDSCHGMLSHSSKTGASAARIHAAIKTIPTMKSFESLKADQIQAIADVLSGKGNAK